MDVRRLAAILRAHIRPLLLAGILGLVVGYGASLTLPKVYEAETKLLVGQLLQTSNPGLSALETSSRLSTTYATLAETRPLLQNVIDDLGLGTTPEELEKRIRVDATVESPYITIRAEGHDPEHASAIANSLAAQLIASSPRVSGQAGADEFLRSQIEATQRDIIAAEAEIASINADPSPAPDAPTRLTQLHDQIALLRSTYTSLLAYAGTPNRLSIVEPAVEPLEPASPKPLLNSILAATLSMLLVGALVLAWEQVDDTVKQSKDIEALLGLSPLAMIPRIPGRRRDPLYRLVTVLYPHSTAAEAFRSLRTNLAFSSVDAPVRSIVVTSAHGEEGKTTVAANLAVVLAQGGKRVILVDADLRRPSMHEVFRTEVSTGLTTLLNAPGLAVGKVAQATEVEGLRVISAGLRPPNPVELMASQRMDAVAKALSAEADVVIYDTPPVGPVSDAAILATHVDGVLLVASSRRTRTAALRHAHETVGRAGARILGVVLNAVRSDVSIAYYGYAGSDDGESPVGPSPSLPTAIGAPGPVGDR